MEVPRGIFILAMTAEKSSDPFMYGVVGHVRELSLECIVPA